MEPIEPSAPDPDVEIRMDRNSFPEEEQHSAQDAEIKKAQSKAEETTETRNKQYEKYFSVLGSSTLRKIGKGVAISVVGHIIIRCFDPIFDKIENTLLGPSLVKQQTDLAMKRAKHAIAISEFELLQKKSKYESEIFERLQAYRQKEIENASDNKEKEKLTELLKKAKDAFYKKQERALEKVAQEAIATAS